MAIIDLVSLSTAKEVQKLIRMAASLSRYISKSSNKCYLFFQLHKNKNKFWNKDASSHSTVQEILDWTTIFFHPIVGDITEATIAGDITEGPEVNMEPPQIDFFSSWKMFVDGASNSLGSGARVVLKSPYNK